MVARVSKRRTQKPLHAPVNAYTKLGFPRGTDSHVLSKAVWNEYGTETADGEEHIPERAFFRNGMKDSARQFKSTLNRLGRKVLNGTLTSSQAVDQVGLFGVGKIQQSIVDLKDPPNAPSTIARKGSSNPLIDTGNMRQSVTHEVVEGTP